MTRFELTDRDIAELLRWMQDGVVSRQQLLDHGAVDHDIRRLVRRKELRRVHRGVFVNHTGELTLRQRQWVAVLAAWPAVLGQESALPVRQTRVIHIVVEEGRKVTVPELVVVHHSRHVRERADLRDRPPRMVPEHATLDAMAARVARDDVPGAFALLADVAHEVHGLTDRLLPALTARRRIAGRSTLQGLITDLRDGACSVLERGYLHRVERAHGLPRASRQRASRATGRRTDSDVRYDDYGVIVELDGRAYHEGAAARNNDATRDLAELATSEAVTARVTYGLVFNDTCRTAWWVGRILQRNGWPGRISPCPTCPTDMGVAAR